MVDSVTLGFRALVAAQPDKVLALPLANWTSKAEGDRCGAIAVVGFRHGFDHRGVRGPGDEITGNLDCQRRIDAEVFAERKEQIVVDHSVDVDAPNSDAECRGVGG